mmetsp:Transcript_70262/g.182948  ORF Transcript_70262/g.182948 Transcript_70262/m.182948 type:complete len:247 (+) Transcript_70262:113-853(+)
MFCCCAEDSASKDEAVFVRAMPVHDDRTPAGGDGEVLLEDLALEPVQAAPSAPEKRAAQEWPVPAKQPVPLGEEPQVFQATLSKPSVDSALGWHLDVLDPRHLFICRLVQTGTSPIETYNASVATALQIREGDYVTAVNGVTVSAEKMSESIKKTDKVKIKISRPIVFAQTIASNGMSLGLDLKYGPGGSSLLIEGIRSGALARHAPDVRAGDRILSVNGTTGTPYTLMQAIQDSPALDIGFSRVA